MQIIKGLLIMTVVFVMIGIIELLLFWLAANRRKLEKRKDNQSRKEKTENDREA